MFPRVCFRQTQFGMRIAFSGDEAPVTLFPSPAAVLPPVPLCPSSGMAVAEKCVCAPVVCQGECSEPYQTGSCFIQQEAAPMFEPPPIFVENGSPLLNK
jgi:hypothetical protein